MNLWLVFLTGLTSGGVTCAAMQGGLLASIIANQKQDETTRQLASSKSSSFDLGDWGPVTAFLTTKLVSHVILGALLGWLGSSIDLSLSARLFFQTLAALFMFATAMNLLNVHPIFRYLAIQPPRFVYRWLKRTGNNASLFAPALFGLLTVFIPCGVTQAMEVLAISIGDPLQGALIMGAFVLGTSPMFMLIGIATAKFSEFWRVYFLRTAAILLLAMALYSINGVLQVSDSPYSFQRLAPRLVKLLPPYTSSPTKTKAADPNVKLQNGVQQVTIMITNRGYTPSYFRVQKDIPVELTLKTNGGVYSCATAFTFRAFGINTQLTPTDTQTFSFTPNKKGTYTFSCSMGMYSGSMEVL